MTQKIRVYQVAKDFNISSEALLGILDGLGVPAKSHMSTMDPEVIDKVREKFEAEKNAVKKDDARKQEVKAALERETRAEPVAPRSAPVASAPAAPAAPPPPPPVVMQPLAEELLLDPSPSSKPKPSVPAKPVVDRRRRVDAKPQLLREKVKESLAGAGEAPKQFKKRADAPSPSQLLKTPAAPAAGAPSAKGTAAPAAAPAVVADAPKLVVPDLASVAELAVLLKIKPAELLNKLIGLGNMVTINQRLDKDTIEIVAMEFGHEVEWEVEYGAQEIEETDIVDDPKDLKPRPPVVTVMGHVDHGKTSLLDFIRKGNVVAGEKGGITQHIGAYEVEVSGGRQITFLDTPGHQAFTAMRARGAKATDIVVLVVAADDRVMPQTSEAIDHAKAGDVPIIVAMNKIDRPEANVEALKADLANNGLMVEAYGGQVPAAAISAKTGQGIDDLLELILLQADLLELKANPSRHARGVVIESKVEQGRGAVGSVLVQTGTLRVGDPFVCGSTFGKVRAMTNERGKRVKEAGPSTPVEVTGWDSTPNAGDMFSVTTSDALARDVGQKRAIISREQENRRKPHIRLTTVGELMERGEIQELRLIIKADVAGSAEVLAEQLGSQGTSEVTCRVLRAGVGQINESDVALADASDAVIIGFNVKIEPKAFQLAQREQVDVRSYGIIYEAVEDVKSALAGLLKPDQVERVHGRIEVRKVFRVSKSGTIAGCMVLSGDVKRSYRARLIRGEETVFDGRIGGLKRFKDDVREVAAGFECGVGLENHDDVREGDIIEVYTIEEVARRL